MLRPYRLLPFTMLGPALFVMKMQGETQSPTLMCAPEGSVIALTPFFNFQILNGDHETRFGYDLAMGKLMQSEQLPLSCPPNDPFGRRLKGVEIDGLLERGDLIACTYHQIFEYYLQMSKKACSKTFNTRPQECMPISGLETLTSTLGKLYPYQRRIYMVTPGSCPLYVVDTTHLNHPTDGSPQIRLSFRWETPKGNAPIRV